jgi:hypothetical protein
MSKPEITDRAERAKIRRLRWQLKKLPTKARWQRMRSCQAKAALATEALAATAEG